MWSGHVRRGQHRMILSGASEGKLKTFFEKVEKQLPVELYDVRGKSETPLTIAYERYCDGLFATAPIERKIAAAIMGLVALYFRRDEMHELGYRLSLRIAKVLSKLNISAQEAQKRVKKGYGVRSLHVHGSHLSGKERKDFLAEKKDEAKKDEPKPPGAP